MRTAGRMTVRGYPPSRLAVKSTNNAGDTLSCRSELAREPHDSGVTGNLCSRASSLLQGLTYWKNPCLN